MTKSDDEWGEGGCSRAEELTVVLWDDEIGCNSEPTGRFFRYLTCNTLKLAPASRSSSQFLSIFRQGSCTKIKRGKKA